jgi:hypothetical protein
LSPIGIATLLQENLTLLYSSKGGEIFWVTKQAVEEEMKVHARLLEKIFLCGSY